jgi:lysophospholipase L1-like esterase
MSPSRRRRVLFALLTATLATLSIPAISEVAFRILEHRENARNIHEGQGGNWIEDARWGWKPTLGPFRTATAEYDVTGYINTLHMNDHPYDAKQDASRTRILVLGDSHTFATGVSTDQTWGKYLEAHLNSTYSPAGFRTYNTAAPGYSMHQYLLRLIDQGPQVSPHYVVLGLSYATDLYDLLPPDHGGWIYGGDKARDYFDFNEHGILVEKHWAPDPSASSPTRPNWTAVSVRGLLEHSATFRLLRRSKLALIVGSRVTIHGQTLWANMDVVVEKDLTEQHRYQWRLFEALLLRIKTECDRQGAQLIVVGIPYLPQVYDDVWNSTFGRDPKYARTAAADRVLADCKRWGIPYVDTLAAFQTRTKQLGRWLHYHRDGHPTPEGHEVIADTLLRAAVIRPQNATQGH